MNTIQFKIKSELTELEFAISAVSLGHSNFSLILPTINRNSLKVIHMFIYDIYC